MSHGIWELINGLLDIGIAIVAVDLEVLISKIEGC
jgi:hypothetical protein